MFNNACCQGSLCRGDSPEGAALQGSGAHGSKHSWRPSHGSVTSATPSILVMNLR